VHRVHPIRVVADLTLERQAEATPATPYDAQVITHAVDAAVSGAHSHEHAHSVRSLSSKRAAHDHSHRHDDDAQADREFNGHTHARPHVRLPWESLPELAS
jgi:hypothetical protein